MRRTLCKGLLIPFGLILFLSGCGKETEPDIGRDIVLMEPAGAVSNYETVAYRSIYDAATFSAGVYPATREYAYETAQSFAYYGALPGEAVEEGDILQGADLKAIDEQIEDMEEAIAEMVEAHAEYVEEMQASIAEAAETTKTCYEELGRHYEVEYSYKWLLGDYEMAMHNEEVLALELEQQNQLYELDYAYRQEQLEQLLKERRKGVLYAAGDGTVVSAGFYNNGDYIAEEVAVTAVADLEQLILKSDYISAAKISKADEIYATINGERYAIEYQPMSESEYTKILEQGGTPSSTFLFLDDTEGIAISDYAAVTLIYNSRKNVVTVSRAALHKDETGYFVYVCKDGENIHTPVKTGLSDGIYTEIVSGLSVGDKVVVQTEEETGKWTAKVESGTYSEVFGANGYVYYPASSYVTCEVEYGTVYLEERLVSLYSYVEKGDVVATVRVEADEVEMERIQQQITRLEERLADYQAIWAKEQEERDLANETEAQKKEQAKRLAAYEKEVNNRLEAIEELKELLRDMQADAKVTGIVAAESGIVTWVSGHLSEDKLSEGTNLISISNEDTCYIIVENLGQKLNYGMEVEITYKDGEENTYTMPGIVVTLSNQGLSPALQSENAVILVTEPIEDMALSASSENGRWNRKVFRVSATVREMDNVLLVPAAAVTDNNGHLYVNVVQEDGSVVARSFISGGSTLDKYWVIDGLEEGMTICYE